MRNMDHPDVVRSVKQRMEWRNFIPIRLNEKELKAVKNYVQWLSKDYAEKNMDGDEYEIIERLLNDQEAIKTISFWRSCLFNYEFYHRDLHPKNNI